MLAHRLQPTPAVRWLVFLCACSTAGPAQVGDDDAAPPDGSTPGCADVGDAAVPIASAPAAGDFALTVTAQTASVTRRSAAGARP